MTLLWFFRAASFAFYFVLFLVFAHGFPHIHSIKRIIPRSFLCFVSLLHQLNSEGTPISMNQEIKNGRSVFFSGAFSMLHSLELAVTRDQIANMSNKIVQLRANPYRCLSFLCFFTINGHQLKVDSIVDQRKQHITRQPFLSPSYKSEEK